MRITSRLAPLLLAGVVALGVATVPSVAADAATGSVQAKSKTGAVTVQLVDVKGKTLKKRVYIAIGASELAGYGRTSSKGVITFKKLKPGSKYLVVQGIDGPGKYLTVVKSKVKVSAGKTTNVSLKLTVGATISGTVRDTNGEPLAGVFVAAVGRSGKSASSATTNSKGVYKIVGIHSGSYTVGFDGPAANPEGSEFDGYWNNATDVKSATFIKVSQQSKSKKATVTKTVNAVLAPAAPQQK